MTIFKKNDFLSDCFYDLTAFVVPIKIDKKQFHFGGALFFSFVVGYSTEMRLV